MPWVKSADGEKWTINQSELDALIAQPGGYNICPSGCKGGLMLSDTWMNYDKDGNPVSKHAICDTCGMELVVIIDV